MQRKERLITLSVPCREELPASLRPSGILLTILFYLIMWFVILALCCFLVVNLFFSINRTVYLDIFGLLNILAFGLIPLLSLISLIVTIPVISALFIIFHTIAAQRNFNSLRRDWPMGRNVSFFGKYAQEGSFTKGGLFREALTTIYALIIFIFFSLLFGFVSAFVPFLIGLVLGHLAKPVVYLVFYLNTPNCRDLVKSFHEY